VFKLALGGVLLAAALAVLATPTYAVAAPAQRHILARDECDPGTFNQPPPVGVGPGTCSRNGGVSFAHFIDQLTRLHRAPEWRFAPDSVKVEPDEPFMVTNAGGELHSFTEVAAFGGGVVPPLNTLSQSGPTRPECAVAFAAFGAGTPNSSFLTPGQSLTDSKDDPGPHLYQCCIHPWMHEVVTVGSGGRRRP
jgi:hypothetical protein